MENSRLTLRGLIDESKYYRSKKMTKSEKHEIQEMLKPVIKSLSHLKRRRNVTQKEMLKIVEDSKLWKKRLHERKTLTVQESIEFEVYIQKRRIQTPKIESMIFRNKPGIYDKYLKELGHLDIHVHGLLLRIHNLNEQNKVLQESLINCRKELKYCREDVEHYKFLNESGNQIIDSQFSLINEHIFNYKRPSTPYLKVVPKEN